MVDECQEKLDALPSTAKEFKRNCSKFEEGRSLKRRKVNGKSVSPRPTTSTARRPFNEVVKDHLIIMVNNVNAFISPAVTEWGAIESNLEKLVINHVLSKKTEPVTPFDSGEILRGYRVIKCLESFKRISSMDDTYRAGRQLYLSNPSHHRIELSST